MPFFILDAKSAPKYFKNDVVPGTQGLQPRKHGSERKNSFCGLQVLLPNTSRLTHINAPKTHTLNRLSPYMVQGSAKAPSNTRPKLATSRLFRAFRLANRHQTDASLALRRQSAAMMRHPSRNPARQT
ncbi:hypothetical protein K5D33_15175 [Pseudomonas cichorii]|nr:hypothetical protein [Pseudomonas cichorii]MBX8536039.1 hypothetical protein [Pseudomonas cichorii]